VSDTIAVKTKTCTVCGKYELWSLDRKAVERWQGENTYKMLSLKCLCKIEKC